MTNWFVCSILLALIQTRIFKWSKQELWKSAPRYGVLIFLVICEAEWIRNASEEFGFEWWCALLVMFAGFLTAKSIFFTKNAGSKISAPVFSSIFMGLAWLTFGDSLNEWILYFSAAWLALLSVIVSYLFMSIGDRVELSDVSKFFEETPIFLISAAIIILILSSCFR